MNLKKYWWVHCLIGILLWISWGILSSRYLLPAIYEHEFFQTNGYITIIRFGFNAVLIYIIILLIIDRRRLIGAESIKQAKLAKLKSKIEQIEKE